MGERFDYIVVGSGAGGSAAAYGLVSAGRRVLLIEKGDRLPNDGSTLDLDKVIRQGAFKSKEPWLTGKGRSFVPEEYFNLGGKTKWYGAALLRYGRDEFEGDQAHGFLPWPISFQELTPFYEEAERLLGVREFEVEPDLRSILARVQRNGAGWRSEPLPLGLASDILAHPDEARHFDGFASVRGLKADAQHALLERLSGSDRLTILTGTPVRSLQGDYRAPQRIVGVALSDGRRFSAGAVLLAAGAMHSPRLLQRYLESSGLAANLPSYAHVGRYFKRHLLTAVLALSPAAKRDLVRKTALLVNDRFPHSTVQPLGFDGELIATLMPPFVPPWFSRRFGERAYGFFLQTEEGSAGENRVIAEPNGNGNGAKKYPRLDYDPRRLPLAVREHRRLVRAFRRSLLTGGYVSFAKAIPLEGTAHACGTLVAGKDAAHSVVSAHGRVHGMENLYVVDGSVLPRISRVNPSLTIYAWALRIASHLTKQ